MALPDLSKFQFIDLEHVRENGMPEMGAHKPVYGYEIAHRHEDTDPKKQGTRSSAWGNLSGNEHSGTHMDAFCHQAHNGLMYGGAPVNSETETPSGFTVNGAENFPIVFAPGLLLDIANLKGVETLEPGYRITVDDIKECCEKDSLNIRPGSVLIINTGQHLLWDDKDKFLNTPGVSADGSRYVASKKVLAVGADNFGWDEPTEFDPELGCNGPGHVILIVQAGIYIIENLNLAPLLDTGHKEFMFFAAPLKIKGGTGSPIRPLALLPAF